MTTPLYKPVARECLFRDAGKPLIVTLEPHDMIAFRRKGCRFVFRTSLAACYSMAVKAELREQQKLRAQVRRERRRR